MCCVLGCSTLIECQANRSSGDGQHSSNMVFIGDHSDGVTSNYIQRCISNSPAK